ncbi:HNH endonuclease [Pseudobutyrivibrio sp.]
MNKRYRPDMDGNHQGQYEKNRRALLATRGECALCGMPIDYDLKFPNPMSATVDHIIPVSKGGHPSAMSNLQLAHLICNQVKSSKLTNEENKKNNIKGELVGNDVLPLSMSWETYRSK